jgi:hypothetical protein
VKEREEVREDEGDISSYWMSLRKRKYTET